MKVGYASEVVLIDLYDIPQGKHSNKFVKTGVCSRESRDAKANQAIHNDNSGAQGNEGRMEGIYVPK